MAKTLKRPANEAKPSWRTEKTPTKFEKRSEKPEQNRSEPQQPVVPYGIRSFDDPTTRARRKKGDETLANAQQLLSGLIGNKSLPLAQGFLRLQLESEWPSLVGQRVASVSRPSAFYQGLLDVWVAHPTWIQELWFIREDIRAKINAWAKSKGYSGDWCREVRFSMNQRQADLGK